MMQEDTDSWVFVDSFFSPSENRLVLQVDIQYSNLTAINVELPENECNWAPWQIELFQFVEHKSQEPYKYSHVLAKVLENCRLRYGNGSPLFGNSLYLKDASGEAQLLEALDPALDFVFQTASALFGDKLALPPLVSRTDLRFAVVEEGSFMAQTKPVWFQGTLHVAKGPASAERASEDLREVSNLLSLPIRHPNIIPPPTALLTLSDSDKRICGYLFPLYKKGNLDRFAATIRQDASFGQTLRTWFKQLVSGVHCLVQANTYHGDIKPDNILISDSNELILIDITRTSTTMAIASPEVRQSIMSTRRVQIPPDWRIDKIEKSEVFSIGRTMFFVGEGISMSDVYFNKGPDEGRYPINFSGQSSTPTWLQQIIIQCVKEEPVDRPSLSELAGMLLT